MTRRRAPHAVLLAIAIAIGCPASALAAPPAAPSVPQARDAIPAGFRLDLAEPGDYVQQTDFVQCVGASMQMMLNMQRPGGDRTAETQLALQTLAREWSGPRPDGTSRRGASVRGWATGLTMRGAGPYRLVGLDTLDDALRTAASAIRETGRPVGLLVWRGRHAWVMSGFEATADPALTADFTVLSATILDPLWPHGSATWGPSPRPGTAVTPDAVGRQFVPRSSSGAWASMEQGSSLRGKYVLVLPFLSSRSADDPLRHL